MAASPRNAPEAPKEVLWSCPSGHFFLETEADTMRGICVTCASLGKRDVPLETQWVCPHGHKVKRGEAKLTQGICPHCSQDGLSQVRLKPAKVDPILFKRDRQGSTRSSLTMANDRGGAGAKSTSIAGAAATSAAGASSAGESHSAVAAATAAGVPLASSTAAAGGSGSTGVAGASSTASRRADSAAAPATSIAAADILPPHLGANTAEDVDLLMSRYEPQEKIGEGTYGKVYKATCRRTGELRAIKQIRIQHNDEGVPPTALREITMLMDMRGHTNVLHLYDVFPARGKLNLVFECLDMDLREYLKRYGPLNTVLRTSALQLVEGLAYCHSRRVIHRDLKPQNVLVVLSHHSRSARPSLARLVLADFGLARSFSVPLRVYTHEVVTLWYRPPEILLGQVRYGPSTDVWSLGCIFAEMATGFALFPGDSEIDTIFKIFQMLGTPTDEVWPGVCSLRDWKGRFPRWRSTDFGIVRENATPNFGGEVGVDLLRSCMHYNHVNRSSAMALARHEFFEGVAV
mmetsp:Transcript_5567/g.13079  ORF Transcript_5567/g.13079 Transcript_5567/m.13079 type:complete len:518 (-) Transcript_5567:306-1859(-)